MAGIVTKIKNTSIIEFGVASMILPGQTESGDLHIIRELDGMVLIGVVDGLGHGSEAALAAKEAVRVLEMYSGGSIINSVKTCHEKLKNTRGAVMALVLINSVDETITWLSIGNVEGMLLHANMEVNPFYENIIMRSGAVGYRLPQIYASVITISKGDILILSSDGISDDYIPRIVTDARYLHEQKLRSKDRNKIDTTNEDFLTAEGPVHSSIEFQPSAPTIFRSRRMDIEPQELANYIKKRFAKGTDDALVLVARYLGKK